MVSTNQYKIRMGVLYPAPPNKCRATRCSTWRIKIGEAIDNNQVVGRQSLHTTRSFASILLMVATGLIWWSMSRLV